MAAHMHHPMTLLDQGINGYPSPHWPSGTIWFLCENGGLRRHGTTVRKRTHSPAGALSGDHRVESARGNKAHGVIR